MLTSIAAAWLLADFMTGLVHWAQDRLLTQPSRFKWLEGVRADNDLHHAKPAALTQVPYWMNINTSVVWAWPLTFVLVVAGAPLWLWLAVFFASFGNLVHRFAHLPKAKLNSFIGFLQWTGFFISIAHHRGHHFDAAGIIKKEDTTVKYCPMTNWLNPILDFIKFWPLLEFIFLRGKRG